MVPKVEYGALSDEVLDREFMPRIAVPDYETWLAEDLALATPLRTSGACRPDQRYGPGPRQLLDIFPAKAPGAPILIWFHGGYWRALSKDYYGFIAPPFLAAGAAVVLVNYDLCPSVSLGALLAQTRTALHWVRGHAAEMGGDPDRLILAGNSAGAHICAMALQYDTVADCAPRDAIRAAAFITGIYDLSPVPRIQVQEDLRLTPADVAVFSPMHLPLPPTLPSVVAVGALEPLLWIDQSIRYHARLRTAGAQSDYLCVPDRHHFSITRDLGNADAPLTRAIIGLLQA